MVSPQTVRKLALTFPEVSEQPHFEKPSFRIKNKIFATLLEKENRCVLKLSLVDQSVFATAIKAVYPVKGTWGKQGWTIVELKAIRKDVFTDALTTAYCAIAPKKLAQLVRPDDLL
jgi:hypothetical protein